MIHQIYDGFIMIRCLNSLMLQLILNAPLNESIIIVTSNLITI